MLILGVSCYYHDSAAALIEGGRIVCAAQEERFTRIKHDSSFPRNSINFCLQERGVSLKEIDAIVYYEKPILKFFRIWETYLAFAPNGWKQFFISFPIWIKQKLFQKKLLVNELKSIEDCSPSIGKKVFFSNHHLSHAASAFFCSPFDRAVILTLDGVGEWATGSISIGDGNGIEIQKEMHFPHSLGLLYSAFTFFLGFKVNAGEYKVMGLAPYGTPRFVDLILDRMVTVFDDGSFKLNLKYFSYCTSDLMISDSFDRLFGFRRRSPEGDLLPEHMDVAASIQAVCEMIVVKICRSVALKYNEKNLCLAGGVALNCVANGKLLDERLFENIWIQPASGDAGGSIGSALAFYYLRLDRRRATDRGSDSMRGSYLGPCYSDNEIEHILTSLGVNFRKLPREELSDLVAGLLVDGNAVGWFQGRMEFGPRALGNRSILADPRDPAMQKKLNLKIKYRESFRPFAPSVLAEEAPNWFGLDCESPYMLLVGEVLESRRISMIDHPGKNDLNTKRSEIPAVTHVDFSARIQTVDGRFNAEYKMLLEYFYSKTGCPLLVNTSFNIRGEPIVNSPRDALKCFFGTELDVLVLGPYLLLKEDQPAELINDYRDLVDLD